MLKYYNKSIILFYNILIKYYKNIILLKWTLFTNCDDMFPVMEQCF